MPQIWKWRKYCMGYIQFRRETCRAYYVLIVSFSIYYGNKNPVLFFLVFSEAGKVDPRPRCSLSHSHSQPTPSPLHSSSLVRLVFNAFAKERLLTWYSVIVNIVSDKPTVIFCQQPPTPPFMSLKAIADYKWIYISLNSFYDYGNEYVIVCVKCHVQV